MIHKFFQNIFQNTPKFEEVWLSLLFKICIYQFNDGKIRKSFKKLMKDQKFDMQSFFEQHRCFIMGPGLPAPCENSQRILWG